VNGKIQPFFEVEPAVSLPRPQHGPSRSTTVPHRQGRQHPDPVLPDLDRRQSAAAPDQRDQQHRRGRPADGVIIDFRNFAGKTLYLENRLEQVDGRGPTGNTLPAGRQLHPPVPGRHDGDTRRRQRRSRDQPDLLRAAAKSAAARVSRSFRFERGNGHGRSTAD